MRIDASSVGETIKSMRIKKSLSQEVLSGLAGIGRSHLAMIETGRKQANLDTICKIAGALNMIPSDFIRSVEQLINKR
jgi:transcriptional regulator with XRE-family HTH domain